MVTIKDVAEKVGFSISTVSLVLNNKPSIPAKTRNRVLECIEELGYRPNQIARSFKTNSTKTIGILIPTIVNPIYPKIVSGIEMSAIKGGYNSFLCNYNSAGDETMGIKYILELYDKRIDGVIICNVPPLPSRMQNENILKTLENFIKKGTPFIFISDEMEFEHFIDFFRIDLSKHGNLFQLLTIDRAEATYKVVNHFSSLGHKRIAFVGDYISTQLKDNLPVLRKLEGYKQALKEQGLPIDNKLIVYGMDDSYFSGEQCFERLYQQKYPPTAIFCTGDVLALGVLKGARKRKIDIPRDLAVIGFDNIPMASLSNPTLSTVGRPVDKVAQEAFRRLSVLMRGGEIIPNKIVFETELIIRESSP